jgi:phosphatidylinositol dimannoside acyltransferase
MNEPGGIPGGAKGGVAYAPHRRTSTGGVRHVLWRIQEKLVIAGYRFASWALGHLPARPTLAVVRLISLAGYALWPSKRRIIRRNAGHIVGVPPDHPSAGRLAQRIYFTYARYVVELMRLPWRPTDEIVRAFAPENEPTISGFGALHERLKAEGRPLIVVSAHIGSIEKLVASVASRGWPTYGVADDSAYPELYDLLARQRLAWGVRVIAWRNLREVFRVLREHAILALLVDWGYREDGIPVRLFDGWTTLPAGPAVLAAKHRAAIVPVVSRYRKDGKLAVEILDPIWIEDGSDAAVARTTQAIADALQRFVAAAPEQWYTFKPIWPATQAEADALAARAEAMLSGSTDAAREQGRPGRGRRQRNGDAGGRDDTGEQV